MKALAKETFTPSDQEGADNPVSYEIKPLTSLQFTEVCADGAKAVDGGIGLNFKGLMLCLKYGLCDPSQIHDMPSAHHSEVGKAIFAKAALSEEQRKN